jgi:hypothetical protein
MNTYNKGTKKGQPFIGASNRFYGILKELPRSTPTLSDMVPNPTVGLQAQECRPRVKLAVGSIFETMQDCE